MRKLTKSDKEILFFARSCVTGAFSLPTDSPYRKSAAKLEKLGWLKYHQIVGLSFGAEYWSLTQQGWEATDQV